jgi:hypothetical protein
MKKHKILFFRLLLSMIIFFSAAPSPLLNAAGAKQMYYEIRAYHVKNSNQSERVDSYLRDAYLPALHSAGIPKVGVFKPIASDTSFGKVIIVLIPYNDLDQYQKVFSLVEEDKDYLMNGTEFLAAPVSDPPFERYESILLKAFENMPVFAPPAYSNSVGDRIYELRSYESATEEKAAKKIEMFNKGEITLFQSLGFNPVFFGQVLMGNRKPNLMYMITFRDMATHDEKWQEFRDSEGWKNMSGLKEYENTVSHISMYLLCPTSYSDF